MLMSLYLLFLFKIGKVFFFLKKGIDFSGYKNNTLVMENTDLKNFSPSQNLKAVIIDT